VIEGENERGGLPALAGSASGFFRSDVAFDSKVLCTRMYFGSRRERVDGLETNSEFSYRSGDSPFGALEHVADGFYIVLVKWTSVVTHLQRLTV
jgi:hypothetical protein